MINLDKVRELFEGAIATWSEGEGDLDIQYENVLDSANLATSKQHNTKWGRIVIREGSASSVSCGPNVLNRYVGIVIVSLFYPQNDGTKNMRTLATQIEAVMRGIICPDLQVRAGTFAVIGKEEDWFQGNLVVPFEFDQLEE